MPEVGRRPTTTVSALRRVLNQLPDDAELHVYVHGTTATVQAEWVDEDQHIQNPVIMRASYELFGAAAAEVLDFDGAQA